MRRFEQSDGDVVKFWQIEMRGDSFVATWGKAGSNSKNQRIRKFPSEEKAEEEAEKQIAEKLREGFEEVDAPAGAASAPRPAPAPSATSAPAAPAAPAAPSKPTAPVLPPRFAAPSSSKKA